jgi:hypothetical protein
VNGEIDIYVNSKGRPFTWQDPWTQEHGRKPEDQIVAFLKIRLNGERSKRLDGKSFGNNIVDESE